MEGLLHNINNNTLVIVVEEREIRKEEGREKRGKGKEKYMEREIYIVKE